MPPVKRRYILFRIEPHADDSKFKVNEGEIVNTVRDTVQSVHGDFGLSCILLNFHSKKFNPTTRTGVLVVKRESCMFLLTALPFVRSIRDQPVSIFILKLTGTLRGCLRALQGYHGKMICEYKKKLNAKKQKPNSTAVNNDLNEIKKGFEQIANSLNE